MTNGRYWVVKNHPWTRVAHHLTNLFAHLGLIAMSPALRTETFLGHMWAFECALVGVCRKLAALFAQLLCVVIFTAIQRNHIPHNPSLVLYFACNFPFVHHRNCPQR